MNAWLSATSRFSAVSLVVGALGALAWTGCGSNAASVVCDDAGVCMQCDGYGCASGNPTKTLEAGVDSGPAPSHHDAGSKTDAKTDAKRDGKADAKADVENDAHTTDASKPVCGGSNGPCACTVATDCAPGDDCVAGACQPASSVCEYSSQCSGGKVCDNGQCVTGCSATSPCGSGLTCTNGACQATTTSSCASSSDCPKTAPYCVSGSCALACTTDTECPTGDYCDQGACVLDTRPSPDCMTSSNCQTGQVCQGGYCLYTCTTSMQCLLIDARIPVCAENVCRSAGEASPGCTKQSDCKAGQSCLSNTCQ